MAHQTLPILMTLLTIGFLSATVLNSSHEDFNVHAKDAVKSAFFVSLIPLVTYLLEDAPSTTDSLWFNIYTLTLPVILQLDSYSIIFLPVAFSVTWCIMEFSTWYMQNDPNINLFFKYLLMFLLAMIALTCSGNFLFIFLGWEGVGIMSFLLIGWYHARTDAATAAIQAVLYNRAGDIGFTIAFCWLLITVQSLNLSIVLLSYPYTPLLLAFITAAASKSAQFGFHPWLASAMEGPTPVSALLHSSTMVVAGIFLLIRIHPLLSQNPMALSICLCLGAISTFSASLYALTQNDIKKIIAYSTSSQLGLMMVAIGLNLPYLAFFHISTHAFFKAMLFLCSGLIIHSLNDEQDIRKMGGLQYALPTTTTCLSIGSFALMGIPFLNGFYSKDAIIEAASTSYVNSMALLLTLVATAFTAVYSMRLIYYASLMQPRMNPVLACNENDNRVLYPLTRLAIGSTLVGWFIFKVTVPNHPLTHTMPTHMKLAALIITIIALIIAYDLAKTSWTIIPEDQALSKEYDPTMLDPMAHRPITMITFNTAWDLISHGIQLVLLKMINYNPPDHLIRSPIKVAQVTQTARIKTYLSVFSVTLFLVLLITKLIW